LNRPGHLDGSRIALISWGEAVYVMNRDGNGLVSLISRECSGEKCDFLPQNLSWSPDGTRLAVGVMSNAGAQYLLMLSASTGSRLQADNHPLPIWSLTPEWSPDGSRLAYTCFREMDNPDICTIDIQTGKETSLTNNPGRDAKPVWSPDGKKLAFVSSRDGNWEIYTMNADGSEQTNLTHEPSRDSEPAWSPDSQLVAFQSCRDDPHPVTCTSPCGGNFEEDDGIVSCNNQIYLMNADGSGQIRLTNSPDDDTNPTWAPK
jgi:Tol biopolymer transport system component